MEIYSGQPTTVTILMPTGYNNPTVELLDDTNTRITYGTPVSATSSSINVAIPYRAVKNDATLKIKTRFVIDGKRETIWTDFDVITPILPLTDIKSIVNDDPTQVSDATAEDLERRVRIAIQVFTGQVFSRYHGTLTVIGSGDTGLRLPRPLLTLESVSYNGRVATALTDYHYLIKADGRYLEAPSQLFWNIKDAPPDDVLDAFDFFGGQGPIVAPSIRRYNNFSRSIEYNVTGVFGYNAVPYDVVQAAKYLINDYACDESLWRDRYIDNIRAADWRFQFRAAAFDGTGNVQADQILSQYKENGMSII